MTRIFEQHSELMCLQVANRKFTFKRQADDFLVNELQSVHYAEFPRPQLQRSLHPHNTYDRAEHIIPGNNSSSIFYLPRVNTSNI